MDFSENYGHFTQDEIQSAYFTNDSSTLFTTMIYYKDQGKLVSIPYVIITDFKGYHGSKGHDKYSVSCFTRKIFEFLVTKSKNPIDKILFQSDGTAQHFKQKYTLCQVLTLNFPEVKEVEWHFSATSHGKGPIDGLGGTIKRRVTEELKGSRQGITSTEDFFNIASKRCPNINLEYISHQDVVTYINDFISDTWVDRESGKELVTAHGTQGSHVFKKVSKYVIKFGLHSNLIDAALKQHAFLNVGSSTPFTQWESESEDLNASLSDVSLNDLDTSQFAEGDWVYVSYGTSLKLPGMIMAIEGNEYSISSMTGKSIFRWPCKCSKKVTGLENCDKCTDISWVDHDQIMKKLQAPEPVRRGFRFKDILN